jgi:hypothetical protein
MDISLPTGKGMRLQRSEAKKRFIKKRDGVVGADPQMDTASTSPRRDRQQSSQTPKWIRHES